MNQVAISQIQYLYAKWTIPTEGYYISFAENGGIPEQTDLAGQFALPAVLPIVQKNDYVFDGWYLEDTYETLAIPGATISVDTILYAKFTRNVLQIRKALKERLYKVRELRVTRLVTYRKLLKMGYP